jgi:hypothetical protein
MYLSDRDLSEQSHAKAGSTTIDQVHVSTKKASERRPRERKDSERRTAETNEQSALNAAIRFRQILVG